MGMREENRNKPEESQMCIRDSSRTERSDGMIRLLRVDGRLVHGMVAVTWVGELKPNVLVVANDAAANDSFHTMTLKLAKPANVDMYVWTLKKACLLYTSRCV